MAETTLAHAQRNYWFWRGLLVIGRAERRRRYPKTRGMTRQQIEELVEMWEKRVELLAP